MLQLELVKTVPYLSCGRQNIKEVYRGTNVSDAEVEITYHNRHSTHEFSSSVGVSLFPFSKGKCFKMTSFVMCRNRLLYIFSNFRCVDARKFNL